MARRLINTDYVNSAGDTFTLELWDMDSAAANLDHTVELGAEGFQIGWDASAREYSPIVGSQCEFTMFATEAQRSVIMPRLYADSSEFSLCVLIRRGGAPWWAGMVHAEDTTEVIEDGFITISITASDGLGMLSGFDFKDDSGNEYNGIRPVSQMLHEILRKLPHTELWATTGYPFMQEWELMKPVKSLGLFSYTDVGGDDRGVFDYLRVAPQQFYSVAQKDRDQTFGSKFVNVAKYDEQGFINSRDIVEDVMASIGASICFADGKWQVWDWAKQRVENSPSSDDVIQYLVTSGGLLETGKTSINNAVIMEGAYSETGSTAYIGVGPKNLFKRGAVRRGVFPYRGASQKHENSGSDLIFAEAEGYSNPIGQPILRLDANSSNTYNSSISSNTQDFPNNAGNPTGAEAGFYYRTDFAQAELAIPPFASGGSIKIDMAGSCKYETNLSGDVTTIRQRLEMSDGTTTWRLSRPVRTLKYTSTSTSGTPVLAGVSIDGVSTYYPKYWQGNFEWIPNSDGRYADAWLETPMGFNDEVIEEGTAVRMLQTDYPGIKFYAPPGTKLQSGSDNILEQTDDDSYRQYVWRHSRVYTTPPAATSLTSVSCYGLHMCQFSSGGGPNMLYDINGNLLDIGTDDFGGNTYRTADSVSDTNTFGDTPTELEQWKYSGLVVHTGDGSEAYDTTAVFLPATKKGYEIKNLPTTRLGASFINSGNSVFGRYLASDFTDYALTEDNLKILQSYDDGVSDVSFSRGVCRAFMQARHRMRESVSANMFAQLGEENAIVYPFSRLVTNVLDPDTEVFAIDTVTYKMLEGEQRLEMTKAPSSAEANIAGTDLAEDGDRPGGRGPFSGNGGVADDDGFDSYIGGKTATIEDVTEHFDASGMTGQITITEIQDKIDKVQTTNPITDDDLGGGGGTGLFGDLFPVFIKRF